jgi:hypothetical protein
MRDFLEERRWRRIRKESDKLYARCDPTGQFRAIYMQNPLLRFLWTAPAKDIAAYRKRFLEQQERDGNIRK